MATVILLILFVLLGLIGPHFITTTDPTKTSFVGYLRQGLRFACVIAVLFVAGSTSFVVVDADETGHKVNIYLGDGLKDGRIIAVHGEKGPQAKVIPPGFHFEPLLNILNKVTMAPIVAVAEGKYGYLIAKDGVPLKPDQTYADAFDPKQAAYMVSDAAFFLTRGGQKGPQTSVLTPGKYRLNRFLWDVTFGDTTEIPKGFVGVIKSNVHSRVDFGNLKRDKPKKCAPTETKELIGGALAVPLVPVGCIGIWDTALNPGKYYVNMRAYTVTLVDTRVQTWEYRGGFVRRRIDLTVDQEGRITQREFTNRIAVPSNAADEAVFLKIEGWTVAQQLRVLVQVTPKHAPFVVASVGGLKEVENRIMSPAVQSVVRNVVGGTIQFERPKFDAGGRAVMDTEGKPEMVTVVRKVQVLDVIEHRPALENRVETIIRIEGAKAGVDIKEVRFLEPDLPPELLVARKREQLAQQLAKSYREERLAQDERITTERARATADQQTKLVEAQIEVKRSEQFALARANEGRGERDKLQMIAAGQKSQAEVLGETRVTELRKFEVVINRVFDFFEGHPDVLTTALGNAQKFVPERVFTMGEGGGGGNSLSGAAAILGDLLSEGKSSKDKSK